MERKRKVLDEQETIIKRPTFSTEDKVLNAVCQQVCNLSEVSDNFPDGRSIPKNSKNSSIKNIIFFQESKS